MNYIRKICLSAFFSLLIIGIGKANISDLDEVALLGNWNVRSLTQCPENLGGYWPLTFSFKDNAVSRIRYADFSGPNLTEFMGYWIGGTITGRRTLHLLFNHEYGSHYHGLSVVNFVITGYNGQQLTLQTYDGKSQLILVKDSSSVSNIKVDDDVQNNTLYDLNGIPIENPTTPGIYIQSDGKKVVK